MRLETLAIHAGGESDRETGALTPPIHLATTFKHGPAGERIAGYEYQREGNPTNERLRAAIAALEGGETALTVASGKGCGVVDLKAGEGRIEHFSARHEDDIESGWRLLFPDQLAGKTLGPVPDNSGPELSCRRNTESTPIAAVWRHKQSHEPAPQPQAVFIRPLKLRTPPDPLVSRQALRHRALLVFIARQRQSDVFCPSCDVASARCGRSSSTFAHGSRESCCGDACWAETCAFPLPW